MRTAFVETLTELAAADERILLLTADLGFMALEPFANRFPDRFFNVGVAEQNMVGIATGLAEAGYIPFVYSIAPFATLRAYEFIRNGPASHRLPVRVVGMGGGFEYGTAGLTHHAVEDVAVLRAQPDVTLVVPADHQQARIALRETWDLPNTVYYRLGKDDRRTVQGLNGQFRLGRTELVRSGPDLLFVTMGSIATEAVAAAECLADEGTESSILLVSSLHPSPVLDLAGALGRYPLVLSLEAHSVDGGVGSLVAEVIAEMGLDVRLVRCGVRSSSDGMTGSESFMHHLHGLSADAVSQRAADALRALRSSLPAGTTESLRRLPNVS